MLVTLLKLYTLTILRLIPLPIPGAKTILETWKEDSLYNNDNKREIKLSKSIKLYNKNLYDDKLVGAIGIHYNKITAVSLIEIYNRNSIHIKNIETCDMYSGSLLVKTLVSPNIDLFSAAYFGNAKNLYKISIKEEEGHWIQQEASEFTNMEMEEFIKTLE